jgi:hypothetical protein
MAGNEDYIASEGGSRKRLKISRPDSRPVSPGPASVIVKKPVLLSAGCPDKPFTIHPDPGHDIHANAKDCHHEQTLHSLNTDLEAMRQLITCKMCYRFLYEPFGLACGHTYCYSCLAQWMGHSKTCPDCRAKVKSEPTPTYLVREMVRIFAARSQLLPDGETAEEHEKLATAEAEIVSKDKANSDVRLGGLFRGVFRRGSRDHPYLAIRDVADNVDRCPLCTYEVEDGRCNQCDIRVIGDDDDDDVLSESDSSGLNSDDDVDGDLADMDADDIDLGLDAHANFGAYHDPDSDDGQDLIAHIYAAGLGRTFDERTGRSRLHHMDDDDEDDSDDDEHDDEMNGFIDDEVHYDDNASGDEPSDDNSQPGHTATGHSSRRARRQQPAVFSEEEDDDDEDDAEMPIRQSLAPQHRESGRGSFTTTSDEDEDDDDEPIVTGSHRNRHRLTRHRQPITIHSDSDEQDEPSETEQTDVFGAGMRPFSPTHTGGNSSWRTRRPLLAMDDDSSDSSDSSDGEPASDNSDQTEDASSDSDGMDEQSTINGWALSAAYNACPGHVLTGNRFYH